MKYSSSLRLINVVLFALLAAGFGFLAVWFGFLQAPFMLTGKGAPVEIYEDTSLGLVIMLGSLGLGGFLASVVGLIASIKSMIKANDDNIVRFSFGCYIAVGYIVAAAFFLNATWLYRLTSTNFGYEDLGFLIALYSVLFIVLMVATNVPLVKMHGDDVEPNHTMQILSTAVICGDLGIAIPFFVTYLTNKAKYDGANASIINAKLGIFALIPFLAALLAGLALLGYNKAIKRNSISKLNGVFFEGSIFVNGAAILVAGIIEHIHGYDEKSNVSFVSKTIAARNANYVDFAVMSYIVGGLLVIFALSLLCVTLFGGKGKKAAR